jgi:hypothetical protein
METWSENGAMQANLPPAAGKERRNRNMVKPLFREIA